MKSENSVQQDNVVDESKASKATRSTIEFPYSDLEQAMEIARAVHNAGGNDCEYEQLAAVLNMESKGGGFRLRVTNAKLFGLVDTERGSTVKLTELGKSCIEGSQDKTVRVQAFLNVPLYNRVYEGYKGSPLPPPPALSRALINYGVGAKVAEKARQILMRSAKQAGFFDMQGDRLTKPPIKENGLSATQNNKSEINQTEMPKNGGNGGGGDDLHPLIDGLFKTLPKSNTLWGVKDRMNWLVLANTTFNMLYTSDDDKEIKITINKITDQ